MDSTSAQVEAVRSDEDVPRRGSEQTGGTDNGEDDGTQKAPVKKRTKTGCLTCRKRRIKCDEQKPTCNNCIKSKRQCIYGSQRVIFKEPIGAYGGQYGPMGYQSVHGSGLDAQMAAATAAAARSRQQHGPLPIIAPRPPAAIGPQPGPPDFGGPYQGVPHAISFADPSSISFATPGTYPAYPPEHIDSHAMFLQQTPVHHLHGLPLQSLLDHQPTQFQHAVPQNIAPHGYPVVRDHDAVLSTPTSYQPQAIVSASGLANFDSQTHLEAPEITQAWQGPEELYWHSDDEASMAASDDDEEDEDDDTFDPERDATNLRSNHMGIMVKRQLKGTTADAAYGTQLRTPASCLGSDDMLASYHPAAHMSPLNDEQVALVFWHFVNVTARAMSLYERHPLDASPMFQGRPVPKSRQHIWTYTFPIIAFHHPALLQAMLALGSLQMATLQNAPTTASMKHYHLSLRRIAKNYQSPSKRTSPATLAATLLLGFYEVWNSDHEKWCKHLWGARAILKEIPLRSMTNDYLRTRRKMKSAAQAAAAGYSAHDGIYYQDLSGDFSDLFDTQIDGFNAAFLEELSGQPVNFGSDGQVIEDSDPYRHQKMLTEKDMEEYKQIVDLNWWYCKMDVMDYQLWTQVAPRAAIGRIDSIYGTYDHLILLLGRLCNFASNDLARKRMAWANGAGGGPPPGKPQGGPGGGGPGLSPPSFAGMMPTSGTFSVPAGFSPPREPSAQTSGPADDASLEERTKAALAEWESIRQAFDLFHSSLGPDFGPLTSEFEPPKPSPFGPALTYRTYSIAGVFMNYYMGLIVLYRAHPSMPPVAMVAAGMAAQQTGMYANTIGRILAGLVDVTPGMSEVTTVVGGILIESCFPMFVAGVQYQGNDQRVWTIGRLLDVVRLTGWRSAHQIAGGCESAWIKAASLKRGPPYQRPRHLATPSNGSVWNGPRRIDKRIKELEDERARDGEPEGQLVLAKEEKAHFALGLIAVEQDFHRLNLSRND
ncbi:hypothetical protein PpBr36_01761 [Pyricularia pennisetigena]|uniref:hypothetical protein n=1 Tax=Pyricularia pennisetigena TaxID=1578925 RepID=UPI00114DF75C|nr:hypothetical protein PpBr36_01761 [Pyricularia pennisetigena]TLS27853.1 hypothetical protein PpBr36_01761 [Pyricularia pennisetigena]